MPILKQERVQLRTLVHDRHEISTHRGYHVEMKATSGTKRRKIQRFVVIFEQLSLTCAEGGSSINT